MTTSIHRKLSFDRWIFEFEFWISQDLAQKNSLIFFIFIAINIVQKIVKVPKNYPINQVKLSFATTQNDQNLKVIRFSG